MEDADVRKYFATIHSLKEVYGFNELNPRTVAGEEPLISGEQLQILFDNMPEVVKNAYPSNIKPKLEKIVDDADKYEITSNAIVSLYPQKIIPESDINYIDNILRKATKPVTGVHISEDTTGSTHNFRLFSDLKTKEIERFLGEIPDLESQLKATVDINTQIYGESNKGSGSMIYNIECQGILKDDDFVPNEIKPHSHGADKGLWEVLCYVGDMDEIKKRPFERSMGDSYQAGNINLKDAVPFCELAIEGDKE